MRVKNPNSEADVLYKIGPKARDLRGMPYRDSDGVVDAVVDDGEEDDGGHGQEGQHGEGDEGHDDNEVGLNSRISQHRCKYHKSGKEARHRRGFTSHGF